MVQAIAEDRLSRPSGLDLALPQGRARRSLPPSLHEAALPAKSRRGPVSVAKATFLACVVAPFLAACLYYLVMATPQFEAEARFAVRSYGGADAGGPVLATPPLQQDAYVVTSFIHSSAILARLEPRIDFQKLFSEDGIDFRARLPRGHTREGLLDYWKGRVITHLDGQSGIVTLKTRAFSPEDARMLAQAIIGESERLANELSLRHRADYVERAEREAGERQADYRAALGRLNSLQNSTSILDPRLRATETGALLTRLVGEKLDIDARLFVLEQQSATDSPTVRQLRRAQDALRSQIAALRAGLADKGTADANLSDAFRRFEELETDRLLASQLYAAARRNLSQAKIDALRKGIYVTVFVPPGLAEESRHPRRVALPLLILLGLVVTWGVAMLVRASVEDHRI